MDTFLCVASSSVPTSSVFYILASTFTHGHKPQNHDMTMFTKIPILIGWFNWVMLLLWCRSTKHSLSGWVKSFLSLTGILFLIVIMLLIWVSYISISGWNITHNSSLYAEKSIPYMLFSTAKWAFGILLSMGIFFSYSKYIMYMLYL